MQNDSPTTVKTFSTEIDAQVAKAFLSAHGIESMIVKDDLGGLQPNFQLTGGVNLVVNEHDKKKAAELLKSTN